MYILVGTLFPPTKPKVNDDHSESFRDFNEEQSINEVNDDERIIPTTG